MHLAMTLASVLALGAGEAQAHPATGMDEAAAQALNRWLTHH